MICPPCAEQRHEECEDVARQASYVEWLRSTYGGPGKAAVGSEELAVIKANKPHDTCPCQHKPGKKRKLRVWSCCGLPHPGPHLDVCPHG